MSVRRFLRGSVPAEDLESVAEEAIRRHGESLESVRTLDADNWLSTPAVVNERLFLKLISVQNTVVHGVLTTGRNLGAFTSGREGFFERFGTPLAMAEHELEATRSMRELGINVPEPLEVFEYQGYGVVVLEYLPEFRTLDELDGDEVRAVAPELFEFLSRMHDAGFVHGDLRGENVLIADGDLYFIDATNVNEDALEDARAYDLACALAALDPLIGAQDAVRVASEYYEDEVLLDAMSFLDFVNLRPDHDFEVMTVKGELEKIVS